MSSPAAALHDANVEHPLAQQVEPDYTQEFKKEEGHVHHQQEEAAPISANVQYFAQQMQGIVNPQDLEQICTIQDQIGQDVKLANTNLTQFNDFSQQTFAKMQQDFTQHQKMLKEMKQDLDYITKKIRYAKILFIIGC